MAETPQRSNQENMSFMSGDSLIASPDLSWDTSVIVLKNPDQAWAGRYGVARMGSIENGLAGPLLPQRFDPILPPHMRSLAANAPEPRRLQVGDTVPDGYPGSVGTVVELDDRQKTIVIDTLWPSKKGRPGLHYTWQLTVNPGNEEGTSVIVARTRMENVAHKTIGKLWPMVDKYAMRLIAEGVSRDDSAPRVPTGLRQKLGNRAITAAGRVRDRQLKRRANQ